VLSPRPPLLVELYRQYLADRNEGAFIRELAGSYYQGTLERLAGHDERNVRRAAVFALGVVGDYEANAAVGLALNDVDRGVRILAESAIRSIWMRAGTELQRRRLRQIVECNENRKYTDACEASTRLIEEAPWFAEAWNQRAVSQYGNSRYAESIRDCQQALEINPYHFAAAAGMGHCYMQLRNHPAALECFRRALRLNPNLEGVRANIIALQRLLKESPDDR